MEYQKRESTASRSPVAIQRLTSTLHKLTEASDGTRIIPVFTMGLGALLLAAGGPWHARALKVLSSLVGSGILCLTLAGVSEATVPRAFVSINGSDTNPCSAVQPCRSFNQALTVVQPGGEIVVQNSGGYSTGFTITQGVTIDAAGFNASVISTSMLDLCTINTGPSDRVVLRGISFHGASVGGNAIAVTQVGSLYVEHCSLAEFNGDGVHMTNGGNLWVTDT